MASRRVARDLLVAAYDRYTAAYDGGGAAAELAEARYELTLALVADGWRPPPAIVAQMAKDRELLEVPQVIRLTGDAEQQRSAR